MKKAFIVIDMQKDFVDGALANADAQAIVTPIAERVLRYDGDIIATRDTHGADYLSSPEGKKLPVPHCIQGTDGWEIVTEIAAALEKRKALVLDKPTFGYLGWDCLADYDEVEMVGTCTDICVVSNALILKAKFPALAVKINAPLCAGTTVDNHNAALQTMRMCQCEVMD